ncbi:DNA-binding protein RFX2-like [Haemaphysalis longicornis]
MLEPGDQAAVFPVKCEWGSTGGGLRWLRPHSTPATLLWLQENYEVAEGVCIPRNTLYLHYVDFCARNAMQPVNAASFGKARGLTTLPSITPGSVVRAVGYHPLGVSLANGYYKDLQRGDQ